MKGYEEALGQIPDDVREKLSHGEWDDPVELRRAKNDLLFKLMEMRTELDKWRRRCWVWFACAWVAMFTVWAVVVA